MARRLVRCLLLFCSLTSISTTFTSSSVVFGNVLPSLLSPIQLELDSRRSCGLDLALPKAVTQFSAIWISTLYILWRCLSSCHLSFSSHTTGARQQSLLWVKPRVARTFPSQSQFSRFSESDASHLRLASVHRRLNITCSATGISTVNMFTKPHFFT